MNRRLRFAPALALLVLMYLLQGCASERPRPLPNEAVPDLSGNVGYVLVSVTKNGGSNAWVERTPLNGEAIPLDAVAKGILDHNDDFADDDTRSGRLMFVALAPGHYEISNWRFKAHSRTDADRILGPAALPGIPFFLRAGEVVYLGNVHIDVEHAESALPTALQALRSVGAQVHDQADRDIALFRQRYSAFSETAVRASVKSNEGWNLRIHLQLP